MRVNLKNTVLLTVCALLFTVTFAFTQALETPRPSPNATVMQTVGVTHVSINYSSPGVKNRKIWGGLVPYGEIWRTGANEVTSITFDDPVKINGNELAAGTYGIHTIPNKKEWQIIFSGDTEVDGDYQFDEAKVILTITVKPEDAPFLERMTFMFTNTTDNKTTVNLLWDKLRISFDLAVNTSELTLKKSREQLSWFPTFQAANYCLINDVNLEEGLRWIKASVLLEEVYWNTRVMAQIQNKLGMKEKAIKMMEKAIELGGKMESAPFDYDRMKKLLAEWASQ
ncbi:MAG: DUF2911 domain-containing protein [Ignavibacteria bacterium]